MRKSARTRPELEKLEPKNLLSGGPASPRLLDLAGSIHVLAPTKLASFEATGSGTMARIGQVTAIVEATPGGQGYSIALLAKGDTMALATVANLPAPGGSSTSAFHVVDADGEVGQTINPTGTITVSRAVQMKGGEQYLTFRLS